MTPVTTPLPTVEDQLLAVTSIVTHYGLEPDAVSIDREGVTITLSGEAGEDAVLALQTAYGLTPDDEPGHHKGETYDGIPVTLVTT